MGIFVRSDIKRSAAMLWNGDAVLSPAAPAETAGYQQAPVAAQKQAAAGRGSIRTRPYILTVPKTHCKHKKSCRF